MEIFFMGTSFVSKFAPKGLCISYRNYEWRGAHATSRLCLQSESARPIRSMGNFEISGRRVAKLRSGFYVGPAQNRSEPL